MGSQINYEAHIPALTRFALRLTRNKDIANDLVQETILKVMTREKDAAEIENEQGFLIATLKRIFIDGVRKNKRIDKSVEVEDIEIASNDAPQGLKLTAKEVLLSLSRLPADVAAPLIAHVRDNKSYAEISQEQGVPIGTITSRINRARMALKQQLCKGDEDCAKRQDFASVEFDKAS